MLIEGGCLSVDIRHIPKLSVAQKKVVAQTVKYVETMMALKRPINRIVLSNDDYSDLFASAKKGLHENDSPMLRFGGIEVVPIEQARGE